MSTASTHARRGATVRTPAQWYCLLGGAALIVAGVLGWIADASFGTGGTVQGDDLIIFEVNGWHNLVHLLSGLLLVAASVRRTSARTIALAFGLVYGAVAVWGLIDETVLGLIPVNAADNVLHLALSAVGILAALASPGDEPLATTTSAATRTTPVSDREARHRPAEVDPLTGAPQDRETETR